MDKHKVFVFVLAIFAIFVIADAIWVIFSPPNGDELQAYALVVIGIFMIFIGYDIAKRPIK
jgi:cytochrome c biogenesis protein CcdA